jgi:hypothetical protein
VSCTGVAESRGGGGGGGRRGVVVGSVVGAAALAGAAAVVAVAGARAMASSGGGREAAVLATRRGMRLFSEVWKIFLSWQTLISKFGFRVSCGLSMVGVWQWLVSAGGCEGLGGGVRQGVGAGSSAETMCGLGRAVRDRVALAVLAIISGCTGSWSQMLCAFCCGCRFMATGFVSVLSKQVLAS